jgi:UDP-N-acetyl-D-mannosaminuronic acid dehydrogenase
VKISVLGLGYVGLPTAALAASRGHMVSGYDSNAQLRESLRAGWTSGYEKDVREVVASAIREERLIISDRVEPADAYIVCVPTPTTVGRPDMRHVESALAAVAAVVSAEELIVLESTVPPGTTERVARQALRAAGKGFLNVRIAHAPERILPGDIMRELRENDRIVGGRTPEDAASASDLYASFVSGRIHATDLRTAEFVKVIENTYRDVNIALANELALFCEEIDIDVWHAISLANNHPRVNILNPGPGVGGHCIPIDPRFLADQNPFATELIQASRRVNERMPNLIVRRVISLIGEGDGERKVTILGASYKANVDDVRESPARRIGDLLEERNFRTSVYDPLARLPNAAKSLEEAAEGSDAILLAVNHDAFREVDPLGLAAVVRSRVLIDCHNFFSEQAWSAAGFRVYGLGRGSHFMFPQAFSRQQSSSA